LVIKLAAGGHASLSPSMSSSEIQLAPAPLAAAAPSVAQRTADRLRSVVVGQHAFVWRMLRRSGVSALRVDEAVSHVFDVLTRRLDEVLPGKEQAFLVQVCYRVASEFRRGDARRARVEELAAREAVEAPSPEELFEQREARALLDEVLEELEPGPRLVFILHEMEQWTAAQIAVSLKIPPGTVASRLRRGRDQFEQAAKQLRRRLVVEGQGAKR
jgi:RNA polymerase sigma-70 factor (ECF subfamily)